ncbi:MAG: O-antigen ligase family protein, partial [Candidatus Omnitrophica bacterium]|nr:O-antigen ligase family protein [Candidatus Omnitrophota bacterium]
SLYLTGIASMFCALSGRVYLALAFTVFLLPLRNVVEKLEDFPGGTQTIDLLIASMLIGWILSSQSKETVSKTVSYIATPAIIMCIYLVFSMLIGTHSLTGSFGIDPHDSRIQDWKNFTLLPVLYFITINNLPDKKWTHRIFWVMMASLVLVCYYTTDQVRSYTSLLSRAKISGTFQFLGPNEVAAFMNQTTIVLMGVFFCMKRSKEKIAILAMALVLVYCIIFMYSRGAYLGLCAGLIILFILKSPKMLIPVVIAGALWQVVLPPQVIERIQGTTNQYGELDESSELRIVMWERGMELFKGSPIWGIGYGAFRRMDFGTGLHDTHNIYVKILVEQGIIGFILFFVVIFSFIRQGWGLYQKGDDELSKGLGLGLAVSMITLMINNFFGDRWAYFELSSFTWIFAGLVTKLYEYRIDKPRETLMPRSAKPETVAARPAEVSDKSQVRKVRKSYYK